MSKLPAAASPRWLEVTERRREVLVVSEPEFWWSHWDVDARRSRRCGGAACLMCAGGSPRVLRVVLLVLDDRGAQHLLELRERHRDVIERMVGEYGGTAGVRVVVRKEGAARNAPVCVSVLCKESSCRVATAKLVESLGLPALVARQSTTESGAQELEEVIREARNVGLPDSEQVARST